ncbi:MAG: ATP--guanido phosphotransferase, partial [Lentisphaeria bacterium]|nr:ATP--guanido phosphotransferase [Lentisphaeria bacterium]
MTPAEAINDLFKQKVCWLSDSGPDDDIAISSRIRFARNLKGENFPVQADDNALCGIRDDILSVLRKIAEKNHFRMREFPMDALSVLDRGFLMERHLISREFMNPRHGAALATNREQGTFVMINEEDHLRIQVLAPGFQLKELWSRINELDDRMSENLPYAFDE